MPGRGVLATISIVALLVPAIAVREARAWGKTGHEVIALIAEQRLSSEAAARIRRLLTAEVDPSLAAVSTWADQIRPNPEFRFSAKGHFIEIPLSATGGDLGAYCPGDDCITESLATVGRALADEAMDASRRAVALKFFVHLLADVHQPLHCASNGDAGANRVRVRHRSQLTNLHALWDSSLVDEFRGEAGQLAREINAGITADQVRAWTTVDGPSAWAWECFEIAKKVAYSRPAFVTAERQQVVELDDDYLRAARATIRQQFAKAGVRLATELNRLLVGGERRNIKTWFYPGGDRPAAAPTTTPARRPDNVSAPMALSSRWLWPWLGVGTVLAASSLGGALWWRARHRTRRVFVCYRRRTTQADAGRIADRLVAAFGAEHIFRDLDSISPGMDFVDVIDTRVAACDVVVAVIGPDWSADPRLQDPADHVRRELATAIRAGVPVIPVLVQGAAMPKAESLPEDLRAMSRRDAMAIVDHLYDASLDALMGAIRKLPRRPARRAQPGS